MLARKIIVAIVVIAFFGSCQHAMAQTTACAQPIKDVSETDFVPMQIYQTLSLRRVSGFVVESDGVRVPTVCVGVFSPTEKRLVASSVADGDGRFILLIRGAVPNKSFWTGATASE